MIMSSWLRRGAMFVIAMILGLFTCFNASSAVAADAGCFIKDGDSVGFFGDSITDAKVYGQVTELVFRHYHPEAKVRFINNGHSGLQLAGTTLDTVIRGDPTVVTIMIGMNDAINAGWSRGMPMEPTIAQYKANLTKLVRELKNKQKEVVIFTPSLTDESAQASCFRIEGTRLLLEAFGKSCEEVAREESVHCIAVQSEFEKYQDSLPRFAQLRPDGVHPCGRGHFQIARSVWSHLNFAGSLQGGRAVSPAPKLLDVNLKLVSNLFSVDAEALAFHITTPKPLEAKLTWSLGELRGGEMVNLTGNDAWTLKLPKSAFPQTDGQAVTLVLDLESQGARQLFLVDVFRKKVLHGKEGKAAGVIANEKGEAFCNYIFKKEGKGLVFEANVNKQQLVPSTNDQWPWGNGDAMTLYLDVRNAANLGAPGFDGNVFQLWFKPQDKPFFSPGFHPWSGKNIMNIATAFGDKTDTGYHVGIQLAGYYNIQERFDLSDRNFIGFDLSVVDAQAPGKTTWRNLQKSERQNFIYPGVFTLVDLYGKLAEDSIFSASVFPDNP